jgi:hypothetical protein
VPHLSFVTEPRPPASDASKQCSFCLREIADIASLNRLVVAFDVSICSDCVGRCVRELEARRVKGWRRWWDLRPRPTPTIHAKAPAAHPYRADDIVCSFCGGRGIEETVVAEHARICPSCVRLARDVIRETAPRK